ncbi:MAG: hypothetical protein Q7S31_01845 [bacterium]|nr:hypothetical protein [bacterium]
MTKTRKKYSELDNPQLLAEAKSLREQITKAQIDLAAGKAKNTRAGFNLRKALAIVLSYANYHR